MEATGAGIAVIASDIPGCRDVVDPRKTGLLFPPGNTSELARQMSMLITDQPMRLRLAQAGAERTRQRYSADALSAAYLQLYRSMTATNTRYETMSAA